MGESYDDPISENREQDLKKDERTCPVTQQGSGGVSFGTQAVQLQSPPLNSQTQETPRPGLPKLHRTTSPRALGRMHALIPDLRHLSEKLLPGHQGCCRAGSKAAVGKLSVKGQIGNILGFVGHVQSLLHTSFYLFIFFYSL